MFNTEKLCMGCMNDRGNEKICPVCGYDSSSDNNVNLLPTGFIIDSRYIVGKAITANGEGVTYIGWDKVEEIPIKVREYFPVGIAHRNPDKTVSIIPSNEYKFNEGLMEFIEINRAIMKSELPSVVPVNTVFEENGTVYAVMKNINGITLEDFLARNGGTLKWEQARTLLLPLIDTVDGMNKAGIIHSGISPETVIVGRDGKLYLSNYCVNNLRIVDSGFKTDIVKGYAAIEQYGFNGMHLDKYTDVYGLCATIFRILIGLVPPSADERINNDSLSVPSRFAEELPRHVLVSIANGLQILPEDRTSSVEALKNELVYGEVKSSIQKARKSEDEKETETKKKSGSGKYAVISAVCTAVVFALLAVILVFGVFKDRIFKENEENPQDETSYTAPTVSKIGDIDSGAEVTSKLYEVPDLKGKSYAAIVEDEAYEMFEFSISDKQFSDSYPKGTVCEQSVAAGGNGVVRNTKIELVISLGPKEVTIANLKGLTEESATLELLKQGFLFENIEILEKYDEEKDPGAVIDQSPAKGEKVSTDIAVKVYVNSYTGDDTELGQD